MLACEHRPHRPIRAPRNDAPALTKDARSAESIPPPNERERQRGPEQNRAPRPGQNCTGQQHESADGVVTVNSIRGRSGLRRALLADEKKTIARERKPTHDIEHVMLIRQHHGDHDQCKPKRDSPSHPSTRMTAISHNEKRTERDVERWKEIERRVHGAEPSEDRPQPAISLRSGEGEPERKREKTNSGRENGGRDSLRQRRQFSFAPAKKRRRDEEQVDRKIRCDQERHERQTAFPFEKNRPDIRALRRDPIATAVDKKKERRQTDGNGDRAPQGWALHHVIGHFRRATETVNIPH